MTGAVKMLKFPSQLISFGQVSKKELLENIKKTAVAKLNDKSIPEKDRATCADIFNGDYGIIEGAKGDTISDIRQYAAEKRGSNHKKGVVAEWSGIGIAALGMAVAIAFKHPFAVNKGLQALPGLSVLFAPFLVGSIISNHYSNKATKDVQIEKTAMKWEHFLIEKENEKASKEVVEYVSGAGCVHSI